MFGNLKEHQKARFTLGREKEKLWGRTTKQCVGRGTNIAYTNLEKKGCLAVEGIEGFSP
jgi:hypothetical protein